MKRWIVTACLLVFVGTCTLASAQSPFVGKWKLDQAKSHLTGDTLKYSPASDGMIRETTAVESYTFKTDGHPYTTFFHDVAVWKHAGPSTWVVTYHRKGILVDTDSMKVSPDGKTLTITSTGTSPDGKPFHDVETYTRIAGTSGLMGTWKSEKLTSSTSREVEFAANGPDGITWILPDIKAKLDMKFDGKDYAPVGPTVPPGLTIAANRTGNNSFAIVEKMDGKPISKGMYTVSNDGKTLTEVSSPVSVNQPETAVYMKE
ncbi:MAG TPA: hypothetical protein VND66_12090 [Acidobacteriaceae bacterium]|nr:hypothetical protein [Acidobacteriaceae bacterium]